MRISVSGTGLVSGVCFAQIGNSVTCVDIDEKKIENLKRNIISIYEPGLEDMTLENYKNKTLSFTTDVSSAIKNSITTFIAVGKDGSADLQYVLAVAKSIGESIDDYIVVDKSTVPVGTADKVKETIQAELDKRGVDIKFDVVSNPEFFKEGAAINDFMHPNHVVIGAEMKKL